MVFDIGVLEAALEGLDPPLEAGDWGDRFEVGMLVGGESDGVSGVSYDQVDLVVDPWVGLDDDGEAAELSDLHRLVTFA
ncbi:MAG: hypothetical protein ACRD0A_17980 [Acidimicrobiales bacterium]